MARGRVMAHMTNTPRHLNPVPEHAKEQRWAATAVMN
nr:MAG TPA: hypothetical protein [Caudoviricetes sp.]